MNYIFKVSIFSWKCQFKPRNSPVYTWALYLMRFFKRNEIDSRITIVVITSLLLILSVTLSSRLQQLLWTFFCFFISPCRPAEEHQSPTWMIPRPSQLCLKCATFHHQPAHLPFRAPPLRGLHACHIFKYTRKQKREKNVTTTKKRDSFHFTHNTRGQKILSVLKKKRS